MMVRAFILGTVLAAIGAFSPSAGAQTPSRPKWDPETLQLFATLPVQDEGRVKPLDTVAQFRLLKLNAKRECSTPAGETLTPMEWLLDSLFYPELAEKYPVFSVASWDALDAVGIPHEGKKKRDRYSYVELWPKRSELFSKAQELFHKEEKDRTPTEQQIVNLAMNMREFEGLTHYLDFANAPLPIPADSNLAQLFPGEDPVRYADVLAKAPVLLGIMTTLQQGSPDVDEAKRASELKAIRDLLSQLGSQLSMANDLAFFPPPGTAKEAPEWLAPNDIAEKVMAGNDKSLGDDVKLLGSLENLMRLRDNRIAFRGELTSLHKGVVALADARGEYRKIPLEVFLYRSQFLYWSLSLFVIGFVLVALSWLAPRNKAMTVLPHLAVIPAWALLVAVIVLRCIIRGRPPVTTLYETILFITAVAVLVAILAEFIHRQKIAVSIGALLGSLGLFLAYKFELQQGTDTMPNLVAVLDTNFWLATHVTTVSIGYSAGLLAAAISNVYIIGKLFRIRSDDKAFYKSITRMVYGVICFGLLFSTLGTVLGGIWANYSWGRFWGWDPKENGALMIVLWELAILHARMGGYIRDHGLHLCSVFGGMIVGFSWFGVNLLGVGLHSYGFTSGIFKALLIFYIVETVILFIGAYVGWMLKTQTQPGGAGQGGTKKSRARIKTADAR